MNVLAQTGRYSMATIEYAGLVYCTYLRRGGGIIADSGRSGWAVACDTAKYSRAALLYAAWGCWSYMQQASVGVRHCTAKIVTPVSRAVAKPFNGLRQKMPGRAARLRYDQKLDDLLTQIDQIDVRLKAIEKNGIRPAVTMAKPKAKPIAQDQRMVLRAIMEDTRALQQKK